MGWVFFILNEPAVMKSNPNFNSNKQIFLKCKVNCFVFSLSALGMVSLLLLLLFLLKENVKEERSTHVWTEIISKVWKTLMIFIVTEMLLKEFLLVHWKTHERFKQLTKIKTNFQYLLWKLGTITVITTLRLYRFRIIVRFY